MAQAAGKTFGVHSEVGQLHKVMVCAPGRAHQRLTPSNCDQLLFDDVLWVDNAKRDHFDFMQKMRDRGIDVVEMHSLLAETVAIPEARKWILDNQVVPNQVGLGLVDEIKSYLDGLKPRDLAETLIGGLSTEEFPETHGGEMLKLVKDAAGVTEYLLPPLPNTLYTRDTTCWIYGGCTLNPLFWPARHEEPILTTAIYKFHPDFAGKVKVWWGDPTEDHGLATVEGGDVMPIGKGVVLIGMSERTSRQGISQLAAGALQAGRGRARHRGGHAQAARGDASRHGVHLRRSRLRAALSGHRLQHPRLFLPAGEHAERRRAAQGQEAVRGDRVARRSASRRCAWSRRAAPPTCASAPSGTAAPISSAPRRAWSSPTTATPTPTPSCARKASR